MKNKIIRLHLEEGLTISSLNKEYQIGSGTLNGWLKAYCEECNTNPRKNAKKGNYNELLALHKKLEELERKIVFLKSRQPF